MNKKTFNKTLNHHRIATKNKFTHIVIDLLPYEIRLTKQFVRVIHTEINTTEL